MEEGQVSPDTVTETAENVVMLALHICNIILHRTHPHPTSRVKTQTPASSCREF